MIDLAQFKMNPAEEAVFVLLLQEARPRRIAEFGCGLSTRFWAEHSDAQIVAWDNYPEWVAEIRSLFGNEPWLPRVDFRLYTVTPVGPRTVEKDPIAWEGEKFDFLFLDGPRSAHPQNFGRSGTFRFVAQHAAAGAMVVWHDASRPHEREMARRYFGHCRRFREGSVGWCRWQTPRGGLREWIQRLNLHA